MCEWGNDKHVWLKIPAGISFTGRRRWKRVKIDACIAPLIRALKRAKMRTTYSCCGHGKGDGLVLFEDGRALVLTTREKIEQE